ncbi:MAG: phosphate acyltransferase PlsX [Verrucomicrobiales bacterium]
MKIALDAMGGDFAPANNVAGAVMALNTVPHLDRIYLVGKEDSIRAELKKLKCSDERLIIVGASEVVEMHDSPVDAMRRKKDSSISRAVDLVKGGEAQAVVSPGHTGATVAVSTVKLRLLPGVLKAGIATTLPNRTNLCVLIDAGANIDPSAEHLLQYAIMGTIYSRHVLGYPNPSVGLMSIGSEDLKGDTLTKETFRLLKESQLNFRGNVEGHDLFENPVEVVVADGFTGNVVLKSCEATASAIFHWLKDELKKSPIRLGGALMAQGAFKAIKARTNYETYGGSPLLGVDGICIIAHGSSTPLAVKNAIRVAAEAIQTQVNPHIVEEISKFNLRKPA